MRLLKSFQATGFLTLMFVGVISLPVLADEVVEQQPASDQETVEQSDQEKRFTAFGNLLKKSVMVGTFTIDGEKEPNPRPERYEISKVVKQAQGDYWNFFARIKYGKHDVTLPIPVEVKWAETTPVITVDNLTIPGMGTFDARVLISDNKYAGTWRHGKVGGLMYGHIEKQQAEKAETKDPNGIE